jgi:hypothetical protein
VRAHGASRARGSGGMMRPIGRSLGAVAGDGQRDGHGGRFWMADSADGGGDGETGRDVGGAHGPCWGWTGASLGDGRGDW